MCFGGQRDRLSTTLTVAPQSSQPASKILKQRQMPTIDTRPAEGVQRQRIKQDQKQALRLRHRASGGGIYVQSR